MKKRNLVFSLTVSLTFLGACNFDPEAILGKSTGGGDRWSDMSASSPSACSARKMAIADPGVASSGKCTVPGSLDDVVTDVDSVGSSTLKLTFKPLSDGGTVKLISVRYQQLTMSPGEIQKLKCTLTADVPDAKRREYHCILPKKDDFRSDGFYIMQSLTLQIENCGASVTYNVVKDPSCDSIWSYDVWIHDQRVPQLVPEM